MPLNQISIPIKLILIKNIKLNHTEKTQLEIKSHKHVNSKQFKSNQI